MMKRVLVGLVCSAVLGASASLLGAAETGGASAAAKLWTELKAEDYEKKWQLWPGKGSMYPGKEPHGSFLTTYVNPVALGAIQRKAGSMPAGSIILKHNYTGEKKLAAITVMQKVSGFNPEAGDWFWVRYQPDGRVDAEGKIQGCIRCHGQKSGNDYVWTAPLK